MDVSTTAELRDLDEARLIYGAILKLRRARRDSNASSTII